MGVVTLPPAEVKNRIERALHPEDLAAILLESFPHQELVRFAAREGLTYRGLRLESIPHPVLANDIAEDALRDLDLFQVLASWLTERNLQFIEKTRELPTEALEELHTISKDLLNAGRLGPSLWALLLDPRPAVLGIIGMTAKRIRVMSQECRVVPETARRAERLCSDCSGDSKLRQTSIFCSYRTFPPRLRRFH